MSDKKSDSKPTAPPLVIWMQLHCEDEAEATWTEQQVYPEDVEYVHAGEVRRALMGHRSSDLWGDNGLIAATMRCVSALDTIEDLVELEHESVPALISRLRAALGYKGDGQITT